MAATTTDVKKVGVGELRGIIVDSDELAKGTRLYDDKGLANLARHHSKLYAEARGSGSAPYRVSLAFGDAATDVKARCTCMAARSRPFCKHAAALLIAWSRAPESFVVSDAPVATGPGDGKKKSVKQGKVSRDDLMKQGVAQVSTLVRELGVAGVAAASGEWAPQLQSLGAALRENKLRRLSARALDLAALLDGSAARTGSLSAVAYTDLIADMLLTARKLDKHLAGEPIDDRHVEELVGKTWLKTDRKPVSGLDLVEYAFLARTTSDDYVIRESRFFDLASGAHYSEKQIIPAFLKRTDPKRSRAGEVLRGVRGSVFPGYAPIRLDVADLGDPKPIRHEALAALVERALPDVASALAALQEHRRDVFAPDLLPVAIRADTLLARGDRIQAVDAAGNALHLPADPRLEDRLGTALHEGRLRVLIGDVGIDAALPTLWPLAAIVEGPLGLELRTLVDPAAPSGKGAAPDAAGWVQAARAAGASAAAIALGEVREELAEAFVLGLAALGARTSDPLAARLADLGLEKQAALLRSLPQKAEAADRIDDFVKLYQILGIALVRLAGATQVDRAAIERVPTYESVFVARPSAWLAPARVEELRAGGGLNRYEAAVHYAHHYEHLPPAELAESIYPTWANGAAAPYVVRAFAGRGAEAVAAAKKALAGKRGRVAKITAIRVLHAVATPEAMELLRELAAREADVGLRARAADARDAIELARGDAEAVRTRRAQEARRAEEFTQALLTAPQKEVREASIRELTTLGAIGAIPALRQAFLGDASRGVREEAALALGLLGDVEMADRLVEMLKRRGEESADARLAAYALGNLGDVRGLRELLAAYAEGYQPKIIAEAIRALGPVAIEPLLELIEARPEIAARKTALEVFVELPDRDLAATLVSRLEARAADPRFMDLAMLYLKLAGVHLDCRRTVGEAILRILPPSDAAKPLGKAAKKALS